MKIFRKITALFLALVLGCAMLLCFASCGEKKDTRDPLIIATNAAFEPFEYKIGNRYYGVDIELMAALADRLNKRLVISNMDFDAVIENVNTGYSDVAAAGLTVNAKREELVTFSDTYYDASQMIIILQDAGEDELRQELYGALEMIAANTDLSADQKRETIEQLLSTAPASLGLKVGVQNGTTGKLYMQGDEDWGFDGFSGIEVSGFKNAALAVADMQNGGVDFVVVDEGPARAIVENINKTASASKKVKVIEVKLTEEQYAFAVAKTNTELLAEINAMLAEMKADGSFQAIIDKYFSGKGTPTGYKG